MKKIVFIFLFIFIAVIFTGCTNDKEKTGSEYKVYYINKADNTLVSKSYSTVEKNDTVKIIDELLKKAKTTEADIKGTPAMGEDIEVSDFLIKETTLSIYFSSSYNNLTPVDELLTRAALVKTLCQVKGVDYVEFYVEDQPLIISDSQIGSMDENSFVDNLDPDYADQTKNITLYYSDETGEKLVGITTTITYNTSKPLAQILVEKLIEGTSGVKEAEKLKLQSTISPNTKLNRISIRNGICYIDLSREYLEKVKNIKSDISIYSIVNTLCDVNNVSKVQFTIDGELYEKYGDTEKFNTPFERNLDLVSNPK